MTNVIANLCVDVLASKAKITLFLDANCFSIASTVSEYYIQYRLLRVLPDGSTNLLRNALYVHHSSSFEIVFQGM